jgi:myosin heavy subunit
MSKIFMEMEVFKSIIDEKEELKKSIDILRKQSQGYLDDLRAANGEIKDLEEKLKKKKDVVLENECSRLNMNNKELQEELDATEAENESLYNQLIKRNDEMLKMKDEIASLKEQLESLDGYSEIAKNLSSENANLLKEKKILGDECEKLKKANRELEDEAYDLEDLNSDYYNMLCAERDAVSKLKEELKFVRDKNEILMEDNERLAQHLTSAENSLQEKEEEKEEPIEGVQVKIISDSPLIMVDDFIETNISAFAVTNEEAQEHSFKNNSKNNEDVNNIVGLAMNLVDAVEKLVKDNENLKEDLAETDHHLDEALDELSMMQYDNDNLIEENLDLKNTEKVLRYQIDEMCKQLEDFRKKMHLDITHNDEEAEGMYYPRTFQEGMREITDSYEGLRKDIAELVEYCEWKDEEFSRINDENYELRLKKYEFGKLVRKVKELLNESEDWPDLLKELIGESDD